MKLFRERLGKKGNRHREFHFFSQGKKGKTSENFPSVHEGNMENISRISLLPLGKKSKNFLSLLFSLREGKSRCFAENFFLGKGKGNYYTTYRCFSFLPSGSWGKVGKAALASPLIPPSPIHD